MFAVLDDEDDLPPVEANRLARERVEAGHKISVKGYRLSPSSAVHLYTTCTTMSVRDKTLIAGYPFAGEVAENSLCFACRQRRIREQGG